MLLREKFLLEFGGLSKTCFGDPLRFWPRKLQQCSTDSILQERMKTKEKRENQN